MNSCRDPSPKGPSVRSTVGGTRSQPRCRLIRYAARSRRCSPGGKSPRGRDRKSTRLNSSHVAISYAVFCLKKKKKKIKLIKMKYRNRKKKKRNITTKD